MTDESGGLTPGGSDGLPQDSAKIAQRMTQLLEISKTISSELNIDVLFPLLSMQITQALECDRASVYLVDDDTGEIWSKVAMGVTIGEIRLPIGVGFSGWVAQTGQRINVEDAYEHEFGGASKEWDQKTGYRTKSMLVWPMLRRDGSVQGVFQVMNKLTADRFTKDDEEMLEALSGSAAIALDNAALYTANQNLMDSVFTTLAATVDAKDAQTGGHTARVLEYSMALGRRLGLPPERLKVLRMAALLHDYGKIAVSDTVLTKPAALTDDEYHEMQSHVSHTYNILSKIEFPRELKDVPRVAGEHHERNDGKGYPNKLTKKDITLEGRILHVCDVFDALASKRYYKPAMPMDKMLAIIGGGRGSEFDEDVVDAFVELLPEFKQIMAKYDMEQANEDTEPDAAAGPDGKADAKAATPSKNGEEEKAKAKPSPDGKAGNNAKASAVKKGAAATKAKKRRKTAKKAKTAAS